MEPNRIYYDHTLVSDKHYFGGFLNLADNNLELVFKAYRERFNLNGTISQLIDNSLADKLADMDFKNRIEFLARYFPVIHYLPKETRTQFRESLLLLVSSIDTLRNFYTHHYHKEISFDSDLYILLDDLFLKTTKEIRKNRLKTDATRLLLKQGLSKELDSLCRAKKVKLKEDRRNGKKVSLDDESIRNSVLNDAFRHLIFKDREGTEHVDRYYKSKPREETANENNTPITQAGLLFLLSMFLSKKENEDMRARIKGFKAKLINTELPDFPNVESNNIKYMATHWIFSYLSYKGLKHQLSSTFDKETLLIQIVDELSKVPEAVYNSLSKDKQDSFVEDINEYIKEEKETHSLQESIVVHPVIRKRYGNKFYYLALRYLDEFANFPSLRFQIHMGNYVHDRRTKIVAGTMYETDRVVKERINVFARLSDTIKFKNEYFENKGDQESVDWEIFPNPSYNLEGNNIMIYLQVNKDLKNQIKEYQSKRDSSEDRTRRDNGKDAKYAIIGKIANKSILNTDEPVVKLSLNELPSLLYDLLVNKKSPKDIEAQLEEKIRQQFEKIKNYTTEADLSISQIPKRLKRSSGQLSLNTDKLLRDVKIELDNTFDKLALISNNRTELRKMEKGKPIRKFIFTKREIGQEATWLTYDLIRFMPIESRKQWKGYQHSQLQQSLAFFEERPKEAYGILQEIWDFNTNNDLWSSEIQKIFQSSKTFDRLYESYLEIRTGTFERIRDCIVNTTNAKHLKKAFDQQNIWNLFDKRIYMIDTTQSQVDKLLGKPLALPRGLFDDKPTFISGVNIHDNPDAFADWYKYANNKEHQYQRFYDYERDYTQLLEEDQKSKTPKSSFDKLKIEHDLYIKKIKIQDLFLKMIVEDLYQKVFEHGVFFNLSDFFMSQDERVEKNKRALSQSKRTEGDNSENIINDNFIWSMAVPYRKNQINEPAIKMKDIGKFKRLLIDEKVQRLMQYEPERIWTKLSLENELMSYENIRRENLLKNIQMLEYTILANHSFNGIDHVSDFEQNGSPNFKYYVANGLIKTKYGSDSVNVSWLLDQEEKTFEKNDTVEILSTKPMYIKQAFLLIYIRNKVAHNQLLTPLLYNCLLNMCDTQRQIEETYSDVIGRCTLKLIKDLNS